MPKTDFNNKITRMVQVNKVHKQKWCHSTYEIDADVSREYMKLLEIFFKSLK